MRQKLFPIAMMGISLLATEAMAAPIVTIGELGSKEAVENQDTTACLRLYGGEGNMGEGARISFGDNGNNRNLCVQIGELGTEDSDILWMHGKHGFYLTHDPYASDTLMFFDDNKDKTMTFNCSLKSDGILVSSAGKDAENVESIDESLSLGLYMINPIRYTQRPEARNMVASAQSAKDQNDAQFYGRYYEGLGASSPKYGLATEDVKKIFPELVFEDNTGNAYIDMIGFIPLLINEIQALNQQISELKDENSVLKKTEFSKIDGINSITSELSQNSPNPFSGSTVIEYALPENAVSAQIAIYDIQGKFLKSYPLDASVKKSAISISASHLGAGMYLYALIVDGQEAGVKKMIVSK